MIFAYVSDEHYSALNGVSAEVVDPSNGYRFELTSSASGALAADLPPGRYRITVAKDAYGAKWIECDLRDHTFAVAPHQPVAMRLYVA